MTPITDNKLKLLGYTDKTGDKFWVYDRSMSPLGYYSESFDQTFKSNGTPVSNGNTVMMLLHS
jgi:hypothetical protein